MEHDDDNYTNRNWWFWYSHQRIIKELDVLEVGNERRPSKLQHEWERFNPQSCVINCLQIYKKSDEVINFIEKAMKTWRVELTAGGRRLAEAKILRGIFQVDAVSPLLNYYDAF